MKTELIFKLENKMEGFNKTFAPNCKIDIQNKSGNLYLNYENRIERIVGKYENMRAEGETVLADISLFENLKVIEDRIEFSIEGSVVNTNEKEEVDHISIARPAVIMHNKF